MNSLAGTDRYDEAHRFVLSVEGGWWPGGRSDPNPTMKGVTQRVYDAFRDERELPRQSVRHISDEEHSIIYKRYWLDAGCHHLSWPVQLVHFDCAINSGPRTAKRLGVLAGYDWRRYLEIRQAFYDAIIAAKPHLAPNGPGWRRRLAKLAQYIKEHP